MKRRRNVEKKIIPPVPGEHGKSGQCLGPDCSKMIMRTKKIWLCIYCRKKIGEIESEAGIFIEAASTSESED